PFRDKKAIEPRHERFYRAMGRSPEGGGEDSRREYLKTIGYLKLFFRGMKPAVKRRIESDMKSAARSLRFEEANRLKKLLRALDHIDDTALIKRDDGKKGNGNEGLRIEAYDVAHLSGTNVVGVMVAVVGGAPAKGEYRKFKISRQANDDAAGLAEILSRRLNHPEWPYPDLIVVDGNDIQLRAAEAVLKARRMSVPVVAVTKDRNHKASKLVGDGLLAGRRKADIIAANAEAHRFALDFHRKRRNLAFRPGRRDILQSWRKA
ncbi:MAG: UvrB/UvrC motif-containing protein, partial [Patescibacteria group bacterium]|nr:UvrB/UvrC motif-containing protein [Patescibacteria group bacterium]